MLLSLVGIYLILLAALLSYFDTSLSEIYSDVKSHSDTLLGDFFFFVGVSLPAIVVFIFVGAPAFFQSRRERRFQNNRIHVSERAPGEYFRVHPYEKADLSNFSRIDDADKNLEHWFFSRSVALSYIHGDSGSGKSSLLNCTLIPNLETKGWKVIKIRVSAETERTIFEAILDAPGLVNEKPNSNVSLMKILKSLSEYREKKALPPVLIVIDQFEEFLTLESEIEQGALRELLLELNETRLYGVKVLCVFRSDYRTDLERIGLPPCREPENGFEVQLYTRLEASQFLSQSGRQLSNESMMRLFDGLDRIEDRKNRYRLVTLNMAGKVLLEMGDEVISNPEKMIDEYLDDCVNGGQAQDLAPAVLGQMVTRRGSKRPQRISSLAAAIGRPESQISATLHILESKGIAKSRSSENGFWEISHDFIARLIM